MKKVYHVKGKQIEVIDYFAGMDVYNGDVYGFEDEEAQVIWIWLGSKAAVEEATVGAWFVNKLDQEQGGSSQVMTINENEEPMLFKENWSINVIEADTPGFLQKTELDYVEYKMYQIRTPKETAIFDTAEVKEVKISQNSLLSNDVFVLDGNDVIFCWIGRSANIEEKRMGQKIMQKIDADRKFMPLQYTIYEGDEDKNEEAFYDLINTLEDMKPDERKSLSVEDQRETKFVPEETKSAEQHRTETDSQHDQNTEQSEIVQDAGSDANDGSNEERKVEPKPSSVAARLAAIENREKQKQEKSSFSKHNLPTGSSRTFDDSSTEKDTTPPWNYSSTYGGAPEPVITELEEGPPLERGDNSSREDNQTTISEGEDMETPETGTTTLKEDPSPVASGGDSFQEEGRTVVPPTVVPEDDLPPTPSPDSTEEDEQPDKDEGSTAMGSQQTKPSNAMTRLSEPHEISNVGSTNIEHTASRTSSRDMTADVGSNPGDSGEVEDDNRLPKSQRQCSAIKMHSMIWRNGGSCTVCGMKAKDCPNSEEHQSIWIQKEKCPVCNVGR